MSQRNDGGSRQNTPRGENQGRGNRRQQRGELDINNMGNGDYGNRSDNRAPQGKDVARLRRLVKQLRDTNQSLELANKQYSNELAHYQGRIHRNDDVHKLEITRLKKEVEYHKRLRQGAEQRTYDLDSQLRQQQKATSSFDEAQSSLIEQSQILVSKNSELANKMRVLEGEVAQLRELKTCLEAELLTAIDDRNRLAEYLEQMIAHEHDQTLHMNPLSDLPEEDANEEGVEEGFEDGEDKATEDSTAPSPGDSAEASPAEASPAEASPAEASPAEASPAEAKEEPADVLS